MSVEGQVDGSAEWGPATQWNITQPGTWGEAVTQAAAWTDLEHRRLHERRQTPTVPWGGFRVWEMS